MGFVEDMRWNYDHADLPRDARVAAKENNLRRELAFVFDKARMEKGLSLRGLAKEMGTSLPQIRRLLHLEHGGSLTLMTLVRACDTLGITTEDLGFKANVQDS